MKADDCNGAARTVSSGTAGRVLSPLHVVKKDVVDTGRSACCGTARQGPAAKAEPGMGIWGILGLLWEGRFTRPLAMTWSGVVRPYRYADEGGRFVY